MTTSKEIEAATRKLEFISGQDTVTLKKYLEELRQQIDRVCQKIPRLEAVLARNLPYDQCAKALEAIMKEGEKPKQQ